MKTEIIEENKSDFNDIDDLIKQILKLKSDDKNKLDDYFKDMPDFENKLKETFSIKEEFQNELEYSQFSKDDVSYSLTINDGKNVFEGYYERAMNELKKMKKNSYSTLAREIESENLQTAMVIIKDKKENNVDSLMFDTKRKAAVDAYKWGSIVWWHMLYELQGKVVF